MEFGSERELILTTHAGRWRRRSGVRKENGVDWIYPNVGGGRGRLKVPPDGGWPRVVRAAGALASEEARREEDRTALEPPDRWRQTGKKDPAWVSKYSSGSDTT